MADYSLTCPDCDHALSLEARPRQGKRVTCPQCGATFFPDVDDPDDETARVQNRPVVQKAEKPNEEDDDFVPHIKKRKNPKSNTLFYVMTFLVFFGGGAALLSCCAGIAGIGAFVWPGFLLPKNELIVFVPADADIIAGGKPKELKARFAALNDVVGANPMMLPNQPELQELATESDHFLFCGKTAGVGRAKIQAIAVFQAKPAVIERFRKSKVVGEGRDVKGHTIHTLATPGLGQSFAAFPSDEIVVIGDFSEELLVTSLNGAKSKDVKSTAIDIAKSVDTTPLWLAYACDHRAREAMKDLFEKGGRGSPAMRDAGPAMGNARGLTLSVDIARSKQIQLTFALHCRTSEDGVKVKAGLEDGWDTLKGLMRAGMMLGAAPANQDKALDLMMRDLGSMKFSHRKDIAHAKLTFADETLEELARLGKNMNPFLGQMPPPPMQQPPIQVGQFRPEQAIPIPLANGLDASINSRLAPNDPRTQNGKLHKLFSVNLEAKHPYRIGMASNQFDSYLFLLDDMGRVVARDDDGGGNRNARIEFIPLQTGVYYLEATSFGGNSVGDFTLNVQRK